VRTVAKSRDIYIDEKLNLLVVKDTPQAMKLIEKLIASQDLGEPEVVLEVEVLEVARSQLNDLGINPADALSFGVGLGATGGTSGNPPSLVQLNSSGFRWFVPNPAAVLRLKGTTSAADILANPRIRVKNREKAKIHIGEKVPVITTTSTANVGVSSSVSYLDTGLKLDVEPNIHLENEVAMKVQLEVSNIIEQLNINGTLAYRLGTRNTATTLRLRDGETQMLAGLISDADRRDVEGLPYLTQTPILKRLFANNEQRAKSEIVLLITPRIVRNIMRPDTVPQQYSSGTESNIGGAVLALSQAGPRPAAMTDAAVRPAAVAATPPGAPVSPTLTVAAPSQVQRGQEFIVTVSLPGRTDVRRAQADIVYDARVLQQMGGAEGNRAAISIDGTGTGPQSAQVRFRVISRSATETAITLENVRAVDAKGAPIAIPVPPRHLFTIASQQGSR
jgi:general secretion pathway protein D